MDGIDQVEFQFSQRAGIVVAFMVGFLVFSVALDLTWAQLRRVLEAPRAPAVGLVAQFVILPAVAFVIGTFLAGAPSIALGLLLVACCPGGALSNYLTGVAKGDVATSISMTGVSTVVSILVTPLLFAFWASMNPATATAVQKVSIDVGRVAMMLLIMLVIPVTAGMLVRARRPATADAVRVWVRRTAGVVFAGMVVMVLGANFELLVDFAVQALPPVVVTFAIAAALGWGLAWLSRLVSAERRAVALEVAMQNVALAIAMAVAFFPTLAGVAITSAIWGVVHLSLGFAIAAAWSRIPTRAADSGAGASTALAERS